MKDVIGATCAEHMHFWKCDGIAAGVMPLVSASQNFKSAYHTLTSMGSTYQYLPLPLLMSSLLFVSDSRLHDVMFYYGKYTYLQWKKTRFRRRAKYSVYTPFFKNAVPEYRKFPTRCYRIQLLISATYGATDRHKVCQGLMNADEYNVPHAYGAARSTLYHRHLLVKVHIDDIYL